MKQGEQKHLLNLKVLPSPFSMNRAAPISISLAFGPHSSANRVNSTVGGWPSRSTLCFTPMLFPKVLNAKQGDSMYHIFFKSLVRLDLVSKPDLPPSKQGQMAR